MEENIIMILFITLLLTCVGIAAQSAYPLIVGTGSDLVGVVPGNIRAVMLTNGLGQFRWDSTSLATTNASTVFKPMSLTTGRWIYFSPGTVSGSSADKVSTNAGTLYAGTLASPTVTGAFTNAQATASKAAIFDSAKRLTNSVTTDVEIGYVAGVTSAIQTQLNANLVVSNVAVLRALPFSATYKVIWVKSDADGYAGSYWWDATIVPADDDGNGIVALTSGTGGFERRGF